MAPIDSDLKNSYEKLNQQIQDLENSVAIKTPDRVSFFKI
jgi:hypothetical protein